MTTETPAAVHDPVLEKIEAALIDARREARLDDPAAQKLLDAAAALMSAGHNTFDLSLVAKQADMPAMGARRVFSDRIALLRSYRYRWILAYLDMMKGAITDERGAIASNA